MRWPHVFPVILGGLLLMNLSACKEEYKMSSPPGMNVVVQDIPCEEVIQEILKACQSQNLPWRWVDQTQGILTVGPIQGVDLSSDAGRKMEQQIRLAIKCLEPKTTRIALEIQVRKLTPEQKWQEVTDPETLNTYGKRFLEKILTRP
jgi:hypothetical protein